MVAGVRDRCGRGPGGPTVKVEDPVVGVVQGRAPGGVLPHGAGEVVQRAAHDDGTSATAWCGQRGPGGVGVAGDVVLPHLRRRVLRVQSDVAADDPQRVAVGHHRRVGDELGQVGDARPDVGGRVVLVGPEGLGGTGELAAKDVQLPSRRNATGLGPADGCAGPLDPGDGGVRRDSQSGEQGGGCCRGGCRRKGYSVGGCHAGEGRRHRRGHDPGGRRLRLGRGAQQADRQRTAEGHSDSNTGEGRTGAGPRPVPQWPTTRPHCSGRAGRGVTHSDPHVITTGWSPQLGSSCLRNASPFRCRPTRSLGPSPDVRLATQQRGCHRFRVTLRNVLDRLRRVTDARPSRDRIAS